MQEKHRDMRKMIIARVLTCFLVVLGESGQATTLTVTNLSHSRRVFLYLFGDCGTDSNGLMQQCEN